MIGQFEDLRQTALYKELERRVTRDPQAREYRGLIEASFSGLHQYLDEVRQYFAHFTDHSITHSIRIINRMSAFLSTTQMRALSTAELYFLIAGALVHDVGMVVHQSELEDIMMDHDVTTQWTAILRQQGIDMSGAQTRAWLSQGIGRLLLTDHVRRTHGRRARQAMNASAPPVACLTGGVSDRREYLGRIIEAHALAFDQLADERYLPTAALVDECRVNTRFVAICLRVGDLLDINTNRVCPVLQMVSTPLPYVSQAHWDQYVGIRLQVPRYGSDVTILGTCPTQEAHRLLKEWLHTLSTEIGDAIMLLNAGAYRDEKYCIRLGRVIDQVTAQEGPDGRPRYELLEYRFNLDEERVFQRLFGERLYGRVDLALRELIQNAVDATRYRVALDVERDGAQGNAGTDSTLPQLDALMAQRGRELPIHLRMSQSKEDGETAAVATFLTIEDSGIGMSRQTIRDYLLKVGRSRWREDPTVRGLRAQAIGEFGIGFLSAFMIADRITIETKSALPAEAAVKVTIYSWHSYLATEPSGKTDIGTTISLKLKPEVVGSIGATVNAARRWCPFLELPMVVQSLDGTESVVPPRGLTPPARRTDGERGRRVFFPFSASQHGSIASVATQADDFADGRSFCQDGLAVPDVPPPTDAEPTQIALRRAHVCVDLRGADRYPLDLSRNLVRGESRDVWRSLAPAVWAGLIGSGAIHFKAARVALGDYVALEFAAMGPEAKLVVGPGFHFRDLGTLRRETPSQVGYVDCSSSSAAAELMDQSTTWILLPDGLDLINMEYEEDDQRTIARVRRGRKRHDLARAQRSFVKDQDSFMYSLMPGVAGLRVLLKAAESTHCHAAQRKGGSRTVFTAQPSAGVIPVERLGLLFPTPTWLCIRAASSNEWIYVPEAYSDEITEAARKQALRWEEYVLLLLFAADDNYLFWRGWWLDTFPDFDKVATRVGERFHDLLESDFGSTADPDAGSAEDEEAMEAWKEVRGDAAPGSMHRASQVEAEVAWFVDNILPGLNLELFRQASTPWDKERWKQDPRCT